MLDVQGWNLNVDEEVCNLLDGREGWRQSRGGFLMVVIVKGEGSGVWAKGTRGGL